MTGPWHRRLHVAALAMIAAAVPHHPPRQPRRRPGTGQGTPHSPPRFSSSSATRRWGSPARGTSPLRVCGIHSSSTFPQPGTPSMARNGGHRPNEPGEEIVMRTRALIVTLLLSTAITVGMAAPAPAVVHASTDATPMASGGGCRTGTAGGFTLRPCISTSGGDVIVDFYLDRRPTPNDCKIHVDLYKNGSRVRASGPFGCLVGGPRSPSSTIWLSSSTEHSSPGLPATTPARSGWSLIRPCYASDRRHPPPRGGRGDGRNARRTDTRSETRAAQSGCSSSSRAQGLRN
jgi:hypothetical protein